MNPPNAPPPRPGTGASGKPTLGQVQGKGTPLAARAAVPQQFGSIVIEGAPMTVVVPLDSLDNGRYLSALLNRAHCNGLVVVALDPTTDLRSFVVTFATRVLDWGGVGTKRRQTKLLAAVA